MVDLAQLIPISLVSDDFVAEDDGNHDEEEGDVGWEHEIKEGGGEEEMNQEAAECGVAAASVPAYLSTAWKLPSQSRPASGAVPPSRLACVTGLVLQPLDKALHCD